MDFLRILAQFRSSFLQLIMQGFTYLGEETVFMAVAIIIFWCVSKKHGYYILLVGFFGTVISQFLKLLYRIPRPWVQDPSFKELIPEHIKDGAGGYSFPSGHTQISVGTYGGIALFTKKTWIRWICVALCLLVPFSRMYLLVHTPLDVGVAFGIALVLVVGFYFLVKLTDKRPWLMLVLFMVALVTMFAYLIYVHRTPIPAGIDGDELKNFTEALKNGYSLMGAVLGLIVSFLVDRNWLHFDVKAPFWGQVLKVVLGLAGIMAIRFGLSLVFDMIAEGSMVLRCVRYFLMVVFAGCVWPLTFPAFSKLGKKKEVVS